MNFRKKVHFIVSTLVQRYSPEKIILFGSFVKQKSERESDIDILIIKRTEKGHWERAMEVDRILDRNFPIDFLIYTPQEIEERLNMNDFFIQEILRKGKVVYERKD